MPRSTAEGGGRITGRWLPETPGSHDLWVEGKLFNATGELVARARWRIDLPAS